MSNACLVDEPSGSKPEPLAPENMPDPDSMAVSVSFFCNENPRGNSSSWRRAWGALPFGVGKPYFAVRIIRADTPNWIQIGVSQTPNDPPTAPVAYGVDSHSFSVACGPQEEVSYNFDSYPQMSGHLMMAIHGMAEWSHALSTHHFTEADTELKESQKLGNVKLKREAVTQLLLSGPSGFVVGSVVGVVCDLSDNSLRWYLNDKILRVTNSSLGATDRVDDNCKIGEPFVWYPRVQNEGKVMDLSTFYSYVASFGKAVSIEMANDWIPPDMTRPDTNTNKPKHWH